VTSVKVFKVVGKYLGSRALFGKLRQLIPVQHSWCIHCRGDGKGYFVQSLAKVTRICVTRLRQTDGYIMWKERK
jgi:hypothetical protein